MCQRYFLLFLQMYLFERQGCWFTRNGCRLPGAQAPVPSCALGSEPADENSVPPALLVTQIKDILKIKSNRKIWHIIFPEK